MMLKSSFVTQNLTLVLILFRLFVATFLTNINGIVFHCSTEQAETDLYTLALHHK